MQIGEFTDKSDNHLKICAAGNYKYRVGIKLRLYDDMQGFTIENDERKVHNGLNILRYTGTPNGTSAMFIEKTTGNVGIGTTDLSKGNRLSVKGDQYISGSLTVKGTIYAGGNPVIYENYEIYLRGSAQQSPEGDNTFLKIANVDLGMTQQRSINTVILNPNGTLKQKTAHDIFDKISNWDLWAKWVEDNAAPDDVIAVASFDALSPRPIQSTEAKKIFDEIGAKKILTVKDETNITNENPYGRNPYTLLFVRGKSTCMEILQPFKGNNAHLKTTYYQLLTLDVINSSLQS